MALDGRLEGKVAVVTASSDGIGLAIARRLAQEGAKVMISSRKFENVVRALTTLNQEGLNVDGVVCHVGKKEHRRSLFKETEQRYGGIDILVSNAAVSPYFGPILDTPEDAYDKMFDINVKATFMLCQEAVPYLEKRGGGTIVLVSSFGAYTPLPIVGVYSMTKTALLGMCKALTPQLAESNIRINTIAPGLIDTKFSSANRSPVLWTNIPLIDDKLRVFTESTFHIKITSNPEATQLALDNIPMKRLGIPEDCAGAVAFLVSDDAAYITGESIAITGGHTSRL